jgi:HAD superfamily hydrolase (TIGR01549 family)
MKKINRPKAVIFDLGDTVIFSDSFDALAGNRRLLELADYNPGVTAEDIQKIADEIFPWMDRVREESMIEISAETFDKLLYELVGVTFRVSYDELEKVFWKAATDYKPVPGIYALLDFLDTNHIKTGIISNTIYHAFTLIEELERHNLAQRFSFLISSADYGVRKPHKYIFQVALKKIGLPAPDIWFVGDKPSYDVKGALDAGLYPVWLNCRNEPRVVDGDYLEIKSLDELKDKIAKLCGA